MDESPDEIDRLFKEAAHRAAGLAFVLETTEVIERGRRRLRYARRRKLALSGLVVLAMVVIFLVPLPQLHLFGSGTSSTSPGSSLGPPGGPIPADFQPRSFTAVSHDEWWMLGTARCGTRSRTCGAIIRTTDGGHKFAGIPSPSVNTSNVTQLRFANALDGYVFDPELWATTNGGTSWTRVSLPGPVAELETAGGEAYALTCPSRVANCQSMELLRSRVGSGKWQQVRTHVTLSSGAEFAVRGPDLYLLSGDAPPLFLLYSADKAVTFSKRVDPCSPTLGGSVAVAADGSSMLWAACASGSQAGTWLSHNGGKSWVGEQGGFANSVHLAAASSSVAIAWPGQERGRPSAMERTTNGGKSYSAVLLGSSPRVIWIGYSGPLRAYALIASGAETHLFESKDEGASWHRVVIRS